MYGEIKRMCGKICGRFKRKSNNRMNYNMTSGARTAAVFVVARTTGLTWLMFGIGKAAIRLNVAGGAAGFARRFFVQRGCLAGIVTATSLRTVRREHEQAK